MSEQPSIATSRLRAVWSDGSIHEVAIELGAPYTVGNSFRCPVRVRGLQQNYLPPDLSGADGIQAITLSLGFIRFLLEWHLEAGGKLLYPDSDDLYFPDELPNHYGKKESPGQP